MKIIELSSKESKDGKLKIRVILHEIYKDKSQYNRNGITWLEKYCKKNLDRIKGKWWGDFETVNALKRESENIIKKSVEITFKTANKYAEIR